MTSVIGLRSMFAWHSVLDTCPTSCSVLIGGCKETVHARCIHWLTVATSAAFTAKAVTWPTARTSGAGRRRPLVTLRKQYTSDYNKLTELKWMIWQEVLARPTVKINLQTHSNLYWSWLICSLRTLFCPSLLPLLSLTPLTVICHVLSIQRCWLTSGGNLWQYELLRTTVFENDGL